MILVGSTGFVGSNLLDSTSFENVYHKPDVKQAYGMRPDIMIYAGVTGTKFWANMFPERDRQNIEETKENISKIKARKTILISTVDVYDRLYADEDYPIKKSRFETYGNNRMELEKWVIENCPDYHIIRLPAIYGNNLKKNFIYDLIHITPAMLSEQRYRILEREIPQIKKAYKDMQNGLYYLDTEYSKLSELRKIFFNYQFNAISFTHPQSNFQYYNLKWLWYDITRIMEKNIRIINLVTEPINSGELYSWVYGCAYNYEINGNKVDYNIKTKYAEQLQGIHGFLYTQDYVKRDLLKFISEQKRVLE